MVTELANPAVAGPEPTVSILVTDDDRGSRDTLAQMLRDRGFSTITATSGEEAIEITRVELIHLVLFDMHMPRMTGLEALQQVRLYNELLPAILVTADATRELIRQALQAQVYSVIPKPVNKSVLLHTLARALKTIVPSSKPAIPNPNMDDCRSAIKPIECRAIWNRRETIMPALPPIRANNIGPVMSPSAFIAANATAG